MAKTYFFGEEEFAEKIQTDLKTFRETHYEEGEFAGCDFAPIHYYKIKHPKERAAVVISHGFCEFINKFEELIYYLYEQNYSVYFIEHRGHGKSVRLTTEPDKVHLTRFDDYIDDLMCFMESVVRRESAFVPKLLYCHSMGGAIGAGFLERHPNHFKAAVLSSPMMEINVGKIPRFLVRLIADAKVFFKKGESYAAGNHGFDGVNVFETSGALSKSRYDYSFGLRMEHTEYRTYGGSYQWLSESLRAERRIVREANRIKTPVLLFQAGLDTKVNPRGQNKFMRNANRDYTTAFIPVKMIRYPESKHEIYNANDEDRREYFGDVLNFFEKMIIKSWGISNEDE